MTYKGRTAQFMYFLHLPVIDDFGNAYSHTMLAAFDWYHAEKMWRWLFVNSEH